jgi:hypothetical protein
MKKTLLLALMLSLAACDKSPSATSSTAQNAPTARSKIKIQNLQEAIDVAKPKMIDVYDDSLNIGAAMLALWGADAMKWAELKALPDAQYELVMKDPDEERGKKICVKGTVIEISTDKSTIKKVYYGGFNDDEGRIYQFFALRSIDKIVQDSVANFCGVVIGRESYRNNEGGVTAAVRLVGMFDLPENKTL